MFFHELLLFLHVFHIWLHFLFLTSGIYLQALNLKATRADVRELISKIQNHLDIAQQATARVSGRSETYGAVQQVRYYCIIILNLQKNI